MVFRCGDTVEDGFAVLLSGSVALDHYGQDTVLQAGPFGKVGLGEEALGPSGASAVRDPNTPPVRRTVSCKAVALSHASSSSSAVAAAAAAGSARSDQARLLWISQETFQTARAKLVGTNSLEGQLRPNAIAPEQTSAQQEFSKLMRLELEDLLQDIGAFMALSCSKNAEGGVEGPSAQEHSEEAGGDCDPTGRGILPILEED